MRSFVACSLCIGAWAIGDENSALINRERNVEERMKQDDDAIVRSKEKAYDSAKNKLQNAKTGHEIRDVVLDLIDLGVIDRGRINRARLAMLFGDLLKYLGQVNSPSGNEKIARCVVAMWTRQDEMAQRKKLIESQRKAGVTLEYPPPEISSSPKCWRLLLDFHANGELADFILTYDFPTMEGK